MSMREYALPDAKATERFGAAIAQLLRPGDVVALIGDLGAGKTTLTRGLIRALRGEETDVPSPTYTLVQTYEAPNYLLWHFDLYRVEDSHELMELGWTETASGVAIVEWPDRAGGFLPPQRLDIRLETIGDHRRAILEPFGEDWQTRLNGFDF